MACIGLKLILWLVLTITAPPKKYNEKDEADYIYPALDAGQDEEIVERDEE